jgi:hypothetical protein
MVTKYDRPVVVMVMTAEKFERLTALDVSVQPIFRRHPPLLSALLPDAGNDLRLRLRRMGLWVQPASRLTSFESNS